MGRAGARNSAATRSTSFVRHDGAPGPASDPGAAVADRAAAHRRPPRLHRRRAGDRLAADAAAPGRQSAASSPAAPAISRRRSRCGCWRCRPGSTAPKATSMPPAIRTSRPIRATSPQSPRRWPPACSSSIRPNAAAIAASSPEFHGALGGGDAALGSSRRHRCAGRRSRSTTRTGPISKTGSACARWPRSSRSPVCRRAASTSRSLSPSCPRGGCAGFCMRPMKTRAPPNSSHSISACRRSCCLSRSAAASGRPTLFGLFDDTVDRLVRGLGGSAHAHQ